MQDTPPATPTSRNVVLLTHTLSVWATDELSEEFDLHLLHPDCEICRTGRAMITPGAAPVGAELFDQLPALRFVASVGSGCEGIDIAAARERDIIVTNSAQATAEDVADHTVAIMLALYTRIPMFDQAVRAGEWPTGSGFRRSLRELNVGVVGLGAIGTSVARRLEPFGCPMRWTGPQFKDAPYPFVADLGELADWADILIVAARADASNIGMIDASVLDRLGSEGLIVNVSRGSIIDEDALIAALKANRIGGAALDVFQSEPTPGDRWRDVPNTVLTPHIGGYATGVRRGIPQLLRANLKAFFEEERLLAASPGPSIS